MISEMNTLNKNSLLLNTKLESRAGTSKQVKIVSIIGLVSFAFLEFYFFRVHYHPIGYLGSAIPVLFGMWRICTEKERYQKIRIIVILTTYLLFWFALPILFHVKVPIFFVGKWDSFPQLHTVGSLVFFLYFPIVWMFGRRMDCGWCCPCVTARETVGYAFRDVSPRNTLWWRLRHLKIVTLAFLVFYLIVMIAKPGSSYNIAGKYFYNFEIYAYYASFLLIPLTGNRNFCRILCPFAGLWGVLSVLGFYRIKAEKEKCTACKRCEAVCDMGIPIARLVHDKGEIRTVECMGCGRCVSACRQQALTITSLYDVTRKKIVSKKEHNNCSCTD